MASILDTLVNFLLLCLFTKISLGGKKKERKKKIYIYICKKDGNTDVVVAVELSEAKNQEKKGKQ